MEEMWKRGDFCEEISAWGSCSRGPRVLLSWSSSLPCPAVMVHRLDITRLPAKEAPHA